MLQQEEILSKEQDAMYIAILKGEKENGFLQKMRSTTPNEIPEKQKHPKLSNAISNLVSNQKDIAGTIMIIMDVLCSKGRFRKRFLKLLEGGFL